MLFELQSCSQPLHNPQACNARRGVGHVEAWSSQHTCTQHARRAWTSPACPWVKPGCSAQQSLET